MKRIILDTNFVMMPGELGIDIFSEIERIVPQTHEICIIDQTLAELENIRKTQSGAAKRAVKLALCLIKAKGLKILASPQDTLWSGAPQACRAGLGKTNVDQLILDIAGGDDLVATNDAALIKKLKDKGVSLIILRQKKYLTIR